MSDNGSFGLSVTPIHLGNEAGGKSAAILIPDFGFDGPSFVAYVGKHRTPGAPGRLIMVETTPTDCPVWEPRTEADQIVIHLGRKG